MPPAPSDRPSAPAPAGVAGPAGGDVRSDDDGPGLAAAGQPSRVPPRLLSDGLRYGLCTVVVVVLAFLYVGAMVVLAPERVGTLAFFATVYFGSASAHSVLYAAVTWQLLRRVDGATLRRWLSEDRDGRRRRQRTEWFFGSGGPLGAVSLCLMAIGAVVAAAVLPELRREPAVLALAVAVVVSSWLLITVAFTLHYAREDARHQGLHFAGTERHGPPRFGEYTYVAVQVGTAYNGADVSVTAPQLRRAITAHAVVAFVFNSVLIALLVSLLITVST